VCICLHSTFFIGAAAYNLVLLWRSWLQVNLKHIFQLNDTRYLAIDILRRRDSITSEKGLMNTKTLQRNEQMDDHWMGSAVLLISI
jgi:hypothetical protein